MIGFSDNNPQERMAVIFENPENILPENPAQVENKFSELSKVYGEENRQLKMIVLFGFKTNGQLATAFNHEHGGQGGVFFRSSFGTRFGLAPSDQQNEAERDVNIANFEKNIFALTCRKKMKLPIGSPENVSVRTLIVLCRQSLLTC